ncbi:uncharacterized protein LOC142176186 [Nicotiana tabacum]|uniref:Uncharacterized protein LOC142176186 n=1 Tax=Nicotiana tabacum TaxID=4097 RepID=A0AC58TQ95_TOBAC
MRDKVQWPKEMRSNPYRRNPKFWCEFHNDHGHKTADYRLLQGEVENLLKQGYLTELFSEKGKQTYMKNRQEPPKPPSPKRTVNVISGGEEINGVTFTVAKKVSKITVTYEKRVRQVLEGDNITFDDADGDGVLTPYNDALNVGATYQRLVTKMFQEDLGKTMEVYIDDMLVKSQQAGDHIQHLLDTFQILRKFNIKLNPEKYAFGVSSALKKQNQFEWSEECQQALKNLKAYLTNPPLLDKSNDWEKLLIYLAVSEVAVSVVFVREDQDFSPGMRVEAEKELQVFNGSNPGTWTLFTDGSSNVKGAGLGIVLIPHVGETIRQAIKCNPITNNEAEYEAVIYGILPEDKKKAQALRRKAACYCLDGGNLYQKMFDGPLARCIGPSQTEYVMRDIVKIKPEEDPWYGNNMHRPTELLHPVVAPWPFMKWVMDVVGPLSQAKGKVPSNRYEKKRSGTSSGETSYVDLEFQKRSCAIMARSSKGKWPEVLPGVLWAYKTTAKTSTGETPFSLVYDVEALIPVEIGELSTRYTQATEESNEEKMRVNLDLLEERRETALIRMAAQNKLLSDITIGKLVSDTLRLGTTYSRKFFNPQEQPMQES